MAKITRRIWLVTSEWYDRKQRLPFQAPTKRGAIKQACSEIGWKWPKLKREGWYAVEATVTYEAP